ncbi:MAG: gliding motility-associated C-terminal domain-containing protein [Taibaiella sp.]|nr:gliding motility-associated C-terminal domain-containing protein [Taibaiella sp.]
MKHIIWSICLVLLCLQAMAQVSITNGDGAALTTRYCHQDTDYLLTGSPAGGIFSGCGMVQINGQWYFNPVTATQGITVFPYQCQLTYTTATNQSVTKLLLIQKPVVISPPLQDFGICVDTFLLRAEMLYAGAYDFQWNPASMLERPDTSVSKGRISGTTQFVLTATDRASGCKGADTVVVTKNPVPNVTLNTDYALIKSRESVQLLATGAVHYEWFPVAGLDHPAIAAPVASPREPTKYTVVGYNDYNCRDSAQVFIDINEVLALPNAFTPNGDGLNDFFAVKNLGYQGVHGFRIYNRWGQLVFETLDALRGWDGMFKGQPAAQGTYFYEIRLALRDGKVKVFKGDVLLMR